MTSKDVVLDVLGTVKHTAPGYAAQDIYFTTPIEHSLTLIKNPWDMKQVIGILECDVKPQPLTRQTNTDSYPYQDKQNNILHRVYKCIDGKLHRLDIDSPYKYSFGYLSDESPSPDDFIAQSKTRRLSF
jgi:hypothetical protein